MNAKHPYHQVPLNHAGGRKQPWPEAGPSGHESVAADRYSGTMRCTLETKTELAIQKIWKAERPPWIPGSSLKGMVRTAVQMTGAGCADRFRFEDNDKKTNLKGLDACNRYSACLVCRVFGYAPSGVKDFGWAGKVRFHDSEPARGWNANKWADPMPDGNARLHRKDYLHSSFYYAKDPKGSITNEPLGYKVYQHSKTLSPSKEEFQPELMVKPAERVAFTVDFENLTAEEFWVFHFALTLTHECEVHREKLDLCHKLGYGKALGLGSCKVSVDKIEPLNRRRYFGDAAGEFVFPPCGLGPYWGSAPLKAMGDLLDFRKAPDCVRFPDQRWFKANSTASIAEWETELARTPPPDYPPVRPPRAVVAPVAGGVKKVDPPRPLATPAFPKKIDVKVVNVKARKGTSEVEGIAYECTITGNFAGLADGNLTKVEVIQGSIDHVKRTFQGRRK